MLPLIINYCYKSLHDQLLPQGLNSFVLQQQLLWCMRGYFQWLHTTPGKRVVQKKCFLSSIIITLKQY